MRDEYTRRRAKRLKKRRAKKKLIQKSAVAEQADEAWAVEVGRCYYRLWGGKRHGPYKTIVAAVEAMERAQVKRDADRMLGSE